MRKDRRYTIAPEMKRRMKCRYVVRYCGRLLGQADIKSDALEIARDHQGLGSQWSDLTSPG